MLTALLALLPLAAPAAIHVAPGGDDAAPGTAARPAATLARAQQLAREAIAAGLRGDLVIELAAGRWELPEPLILDARDSGTAEHAVIWRGAAGADVVLSGGTTLSNWRVAGRRWVVAVPEALRQSRQLTVGGRPATRGREPDGPADDETSYARMRGGALTADRARYTVTVPPETVPVTAGLEDLEIGWLGNWEVCRKRVEAVDRATGEVTLRGPHSGVHDAMQPGDGRPFWFEGAPELVDQPGEWAIDSAAGELVYFPREGQAPADSPAVLGRHGRLLELRGTPAAPVRNVHFVGLTFQDADWRLPEFGVNGIQASHFTVPRPGQVGWDWSTWGCMEPAIGWWYAVDCSLRDGVLRHLAGVGLRLYEGCHDNQIEGNLVEEIGGTGIMVGESSTPPGWTVETAADDRLTATGNRVANCLVRRCGTGDHGAVGIWAGFSAGTVIETCEVYDLPYTGISVGWRWDPSPTPCRDNQIRDNLVYDVLKVLCDGGCLYTLGLQPGSVIEGNLFRDVHRSAVAHGAPNNGIFFDQGSTGFHVERNLIYATSGEPIRFNQCGPGDQTWGDNTFGLTLAGEGVRGAALAGDGTGSAVEVPHDPALDPPAMTIEAWVQVDEPPDGDPRRWVVNKNDDEWTAGHFALMVQGTRAGAYLNNLGGQDGMREAWSPDGALTHGEWHHLAMSYGGADLVVYLDGEEIARTAVGETRAPGTTPLVIGRRQDGYNHFRGLIDEVRLYDRVLTTAQLHARYAAGGRPVDDGVTAVGWWSFDDLDGPNRLLAEFEAGAGLETPYRRRWER